MLFRAAGEIRHSLVNGPGVRYVIFFQGCPHKCPGCHNPETHTIGAGGVMVETEDVLARIHQAKCLDGITLSGGEPFLQPEACAALARGAHAMGLTVWAYTGWTVEELMHDARKMLALKEIDVLVDGAFLESQKSDALLWRGSSNQRLIAVAETLKQGRAVLDREDSM